jgi:hypothetical protein
MGILFSDSGTGEGIQPVGSGTLSGTGNNMSEDCAGNNNATLTVHLKGEDLQRSATGHYAGTLVLLVEPE